MKKICTVFAALLFSTMAFSQTYNSPESIEFDYVNNRWLISNNGGDNILARNSATGALSIFTAIGSTGTGPHGLEIVNDTVYVCKAGTIRAYNLNTAALVFSKTITGASFLNGITHDATGNLYMTDYSNNKIFKFYIANRSFTTFVGTGLTQPNGIIYDQPNNRCVFVQWTGAVKAVSLVDSTVATLVASTGLSSIDGITKDGIGNYYLSSWSPTRISKYDNTFTTQTTAVGTGMGLSSPADIFYNVLTDTLGVPNSGTGNNTTYYYFGSPTSITESSASNSDFSVSPNPVLKSAEIKYVLSTESNVKIDLFDVTGKVVKRILNESQSKGQHTQTFDRASLPAGNYFFNFTTSEGTSTKKIVIAE